ncbi:hypothetical protein B4N89_09905 [Embleya scabrispora]|uniref:Uncharacterized protein n=1 Tax=Embleya scabrispora TaxID=159449 RepID=A0A1T3NWM2_9ACTN|nr:hypothetical protein [Embleya scabrispora]OPC81218.1 hypothetical protein B4N89_09905 [Embleya scabrispora]
MAAVVWWWAIPGVALVIAVSWATWTGRALRTPSMRDSMTAFEEWSAALDRLRTATPVVPDPADDTPDTTLPRTAHDNP